MLGTPQPHPQSGVLMVIVMVMVCFTQTPIYQLHPKASNLLALTCMRAILCSTVVSLALIASHLDLMRAIWVVWTVGGPGAGSASRASKAAQNKEKRDGQGRGMLCSRFWPVAAGYAACSKGEAHAA